MGSARNLLVFQRELMDDSREGFEVCLQLDDLGFVVLPEFFELDDLLSQALLAVRHLTSGPDLVVELGFQVQVSLCEGVARDASLHGESDDGQGTVGVFGGPARMRSIAARMRSRSSRTGITGWSPEG